MPHSPENPKIYSIPYFGPNSQNVYLFQTVWDAVVLETLNNIILQWHHTEIRSVLEYAAPVWAGLTSLQSRCFLDERKRRRGRGWVGEKNSIPCPLPPFPNSPQSRTLGRSVVLIPDFLGCPIQGGGREFTTCSLIRLLCRLWPAFLSKQPCWVSAEGDVADYPASIAGALRSGIISFPICCLAYFPSEQLPIVVSNYVLVILGSLPPTRTGLSHLNMDVTIFSILIISNNIVDVCCFTYMDWPLMQFSFLLPY